MKPPSSLVSPRAFLRREIFLAKVLSSTKVSGQIACMRSPLSTILTVPATRTSKRIDGLGGERNQFTGAAEQSFAGVDPVGTKPISLNFRLAHAESPNVYSEYHRSSGEEIHAALWRGSLSTKTALPAFF